MPTAQAFMLLDMKLEAAEQEAEREQAKQYLEYLMKIFSHPAQPGESEAFARERVRFGNEMKPKSLRAAPKVFTWSNIPAEVLAEYENNPLQLGEGKGG